MKTNTCSALVKSVAVLAACAFLSAASAHAKNYTPAADTYVMNGSSGANGDINYGTVTTIQTRNTQHNSAHRLAYVRFDLDGFADDPVSDATLTFTFASRALNNVTADYSTVSVFGLNYNYDAPDGNLGLDWIEASNPAEEIVGLTNNNAPWKASSSNAVPAIVTLLGTFQVPLQTSPAGGTQFSITGTALKDFLETFRLNGVDNVTFILRSSTDATLNFASRESTTYTNPTTLSVTYAAAAIPEPATCTALAGLAALVAVATLRRRRSS
ncbi:MAG: PEP-CTERM sorting domain-containing protein [Opitutaceae bacterium]|jgi:MYXO-CTERM domain-containing protein|nr:PEP-CTERM sorting domain-containing protein [Opitutaceae bacterium]